MTRTIRLTALAALSTLVAMAVAPGADAAPESTQQSELRALVAGKALAAGVDPAKVFSTRVTVPQLRDGTFAPVEMTVGDALDELSAITGAGTRDSGPAGTPEIAAGDTVHAWASAGRGSQLLSVSESALVPATPLVLLPPPATLLFIEYGGALTHIVGDYDAGFHTAGTVVGSSVDTAPGSSTPVWLPAVSSGIVTDTSIDFLGHALFAQGQGCFLGFCVALGGLLGDGVMLFDNTSPLALPSIP